MKRIVVVFLLLFFNALAVNADDLPAVDEWTDIGNMQDAWDGQKIITDDEFEKVIEQRTKKAKEKQAKKFKKKMGEALNPNPETETNILEMRKIAEDYPTLLVPKTLVVENIVVSPGFYRVLAAKNKEGSFYINFYQGNNLVAKIPARETDDDFGAETINYAKIIYIDNEQRARIVFGCIDYNLVAETITK